MVGSNLGANTVFCDVDPHTLNLDPDKLETLITPWTKAIVPVHLFGQCCEMDKICEIAQQNGVAVIVDCAHYPIGRRSGLQARMFPVHPRLTDQAIDYMADAIIELAND